MISVSGASEIGQVARAARLAGGDLTPRMRKGLAKAGPPAKKFVVTEIHAKLPQRGGLARTMAKAIRVRVRQDLGLTTAGLTIATTAKGRNQLRHIGSINRGILRHPIYGRRTAWVTQRVPSEFWDDAMEHVETDAHQRMRDVVAETITALQG